MTPQLAQALEQRATPEAAGQTAQTTRNDLAQLNEQLRGHSPAEIIGAVGELGRRPLVTTSFGTESAVLLHLLHRHFPRLPVVWLDSGENSDLTYEFVERLRQRLDLDLHIYRPREDTGIDLQTADLQERSEHFKREPFARMLDELRPDLWFAGIRRDETEFRRSLDVLSWGRPGVLRVAPLFWQDKDWGLEYLRAHDLPSNDAYWDVVKGEAEKTECGLHLA